MNALLCATCPVPAECLSPAFTIISTPQGGQRGLGAGRVERNSSVYDALDAISNG
jgi:hypothetical protein